MASDVRPTEAELRAFVGRKADRYLRRWRWYIDHDALGAGTLWPPFFFGPIWFLYRRLYREVWLPIGLLVVIGAVQGFTEGVVEVRSGMPYSTPKAIDLLINLALGFTTSWLGSFLYLRKLRRAVVLARQQASTDEESLQILSASGGTSWAAAALGAAIAVPLILVSLA